MHGKIVTDIEQSKVLAEISPPESADMFFCNFGYSARLLPKDDVDARTYPVITPAWSLVALLNHLKQRYYVKLEHDGVSWSITCIGHDSQKKYTLSLFDDTIDACWGMILRLRKE